jgi:hypothetical protein
MNSNRQRTDETGRTKCIGDPHAVCGPYVLNVKMWCGTRNCNPDTDFVSV